MAQCPICKSAAEEIDRGFFDGVGFDCRRHGRFRVTGTVIKLMESNEWTRRAWENALMVAKRAAKLGDLPLIKSDQAASGLEGVLVPPQQVAPPQQDAAKAD